MKHTESIIDHLQSILYQTQNQKENKGRIKERVRVENTPWW
jgi:hypothetical protein